MKRKHWCGFPGILPLVAASRRRVLAMIAIQQFKASAAGAESVKAEDNSATPLEAGNQLSREVLRFLQTRHKGRDV